MPQSAVEQSRSIPSSRRRDKPQLSCTLCRRRKLRCDREQPCGNCVTRGQSGTCTFIASTASKNSDHGQIPVQDATSQSDHDPPQPRAASIHLAAVITAETSVPSIHASPLALNAALLTHQPDVAMSEEIPLLHFRDGEDRLIFTDQETTFVSGNDWRTMLEDIAASEAADSHGQLETRTTAGSSSNFEEPDMFFGHYERMTAQEILAAVPTRPIVDSLVAAYFMEKDISSVVVHNSSFLKKYEQFWAHPRDAPIVWVGLLFSIMCLMICFQERSVIPSSERKYQISAYKEKSIQCLVLGKYAKGPKYTIETLLLHHRINNLRKVNNTETSLFLGLVTRLAHHLGYHKDPSQFSNLSVFEGELRRRAWFLIILFESLTATQSGLPRTIYPFYVDAAEPQSLFDEDIYEHMTTLPPARSGGALPLITYMIAKNQILDIGVAIVALGSRRNGVAIDEIKSLDKLLDVTYTSIPQELQPKTMAASLMDTPDLILHRIDLALLYQKFKCVLHQRYVDYPENTCLRSNSGSICIKSATEILRYQSILHQESQVGGRFHQYGWNVSYLDNDCFPVATTIICREVIAQVRNPNVSLVGLQEGVQLRDALKQTIEILESITSPSQDDQILLGVVKTVVEKARIFDSANNDHDSNMSESMGAANGSPPDSPSKSSITTSDANLARPQPDLVYSGSWMWR